MEAPGGLGLTAGSAVVVRPRRQHDAVLAPAASGASGRPTATPRERERPVSLYDNLKNGVNGYGYGYGSNGAGLDSGSGSGRDWERGQRGLEAGTSSSVGNLNSVHANGLGLGLGQPLELAANLERARTPSQANCLSTTVPQNIAPQGFSSRHAPTRSSLRHSRMIVLTREGRVPRKYQPSVVRARRLGMSLVALMTLLGALVTVIAVWLILWAPNLPARDVPSYSGPPLVAAGLTGLLLLGCCRKDYPGRPYACCVFSFKVVNVALATLAGLAAMCASVFALLHLVSLWGAACEPVAVAALAASAPAPATSPSNSSVNVKANGTWTCECRPRPVLAPLLELGPRLYPDLSCAEVSSILTVILTGSSAANALAGLLAAWYVLLHWTSRYSNVYSKVRTSEAGPVVISNKT